MVTEKMAAAMQESVRSISGVSANHIVKRYRKKVRANVRRLSKSVFPWISSLKPKKTASTVISQAHLSPTLV